MSLGRFNPIEPPRTFSNHSTAQGTRPVVELEISSEWFILQTCSNHSTEQETKLVVELNISSVWFNPTEPAQTIVKGRKPDLWWIVNYLIIIISSEAQWFKEVW